MSEQSSIYVPTSVADEIDAIHRQHGRSIDPKWRTVQRALRQFSDDGDGDE